MRKHLTFSVFLLLLLGLTGYLVEYIYLPRARHLPRDAYLMGWIGYPGNKIDDTVLNAMGLTGDVPDATRRAEGRRLLTLGGSALFNRRFTERLKEAVGAGSAGEFEVVGSAYRGHTSRSSVLKYDFLADSHAFDFVLIYHGINDAWANNVAPEAFSPGYEHLGAWYRRNWILNHSILARDLYNNHLYRKPERRNGASAFRSTDTFRNNLEHIIRRALGEGSVPLLVTFASCVPPDYDLQRFLAGEVSYNNPERYDPQAIEGWGPKDMVLEAIRQHNAVTRELAATYGVPLLDAAQVFGSNTVDFGDICHFSEPGTVRFARLLADFILEQYRLTVQLSDT